MSESGFAKKFSRRSRLVEHRDQHMLDRHVFVLELAGFLLGASQHAAKALGRIHLSAVGAATGDPGNFPEFRLELSSQRRAIDAAQRDD